MSIRYTNAVWKTNLSQTEKIIMLALADYASESGECFPSMQALVKKCSITDRAIQKTLIKLIEKNLLKIIKRNARSSIYFLSMDNIVLHKIDDEIILSDNQEDGHNPEPRSPRTTFTPTPNVVHPEPRSPRTTFTTTPNVVRLDPEPRSPIITNESSIEPSVFKKTKEKKEKVEPPKPDNVDKQVWQDFLQVRKAKKAPLTQTALKGIEKEAIKAGVGLEDALNVCCQRNWVGFRAEWLNESKTAQKGYVHVNKQEALEASNRAVVERLLKKEGLL